MKKLTRYGLLTVLTLALALGVLPMQTAQLPVAEANPGTQWNASYFNNRNLSGSPVVTRIDDAINFNWAGGSPDAAVPADKLYPPYSVIKTVQDVPELELKRIQHFFEHYKDLEKGKWVKVQGWEGPEAARKEIVDGAERCAKGGE